MKYLKTFEAREQGSMPDELFAEQKKYDDLLKSCQDIFAELIDSKDVSVNYEEFVDCGRGYEKVVVIDCSTYKIKQKYPKFEDFLQKTEDLVEVMKDIQVGLNRLKDEYSHMIEESPLTIEFENKDRHISFYISFMTWKPYVKKPLFTPVFVNPMPPIQRPGFRYL